MMIHEKQQNVQLLEYQTRSSLYFLEVTKPLTMRPILIVLLITVGLVSCSSVTNDVTSFNDCSSLADAFVLHFDDTLQLAEKTAKYVNENQVNQSPSSTEKENENGEPWWHLDDLYWKIHNLKSRPKDKLHAEIKAACSRDADDRQKDLSARQNDDYPGSQIVALIRQLLNSLIS